MPLAANQGHLCLHPENINGAYTCNGKKISVLVLRNERMNGVSKKTEEIYVFILKN